MSINLELRPQIETLDRRKETKESEKDYKDYSIKPILVEAEEAHREGIVKYVEKEDSTEELPWGSAIFTHPKLEKYPHINSTDIVIPPYMQHCDGVKATFADLNKPLSELSNSPLLEEGITLREKYVEEAQRYNEMVIETWQSGGWEPDYGTYVFYPFDRTLKLIAPKYWHRLGLVTSNAKLLTDPKKEKTWRELREILEGKVVGFWGASVGGAVVEGWLRESRADIVKIADPDDVELTNLNRGERMSLRYLTGTRADKVMQTGTNFHSYDPKNPYLMKRINKAEYLAHEMHYVDPYTTIFVYSEGINDENIERFINGNGEEPSIEVLVEEVDDEEIKAKARKFGRKHRKSVLTMSDLGDLSQGQFQDYEHNPDTSLGYKVSDEEFFAALKQAQEGTRDDFFTFIDALCGDDYRRDNFGDWVLGKGEQPTASLPQSGPIAMISGGIGGRVLAMYALGHKIPERFIFDIRNMEAETG